MTRRPHRIPCALAAAALALLAGCGGADSEDATPDHRAGALLLPESITSALLDDEGRVMPGDSAAVPQDPAARTRSGRYATPAQAEQLMLAMGSAAIGVTVGISAIAGDAIDIATAAVARQQAALGLGFDAPVLVRGPDLSLAAAVANRLEERGHARVFLVTR